MIPCCFTVIIGRVTAAADHRGGSKSASDPLMHARRVVIVRFNLHGAAVHHLRETATVYSLLRRCLWLSRRRPGSLSASDDPLLLASRIVGSRRTAATTSLVLQHIRNVKVVVDGLMHTCTGDGRSPPRPDRGGYPCCAR